MRSILEEEVAVELQHVNVKLLLENPEDLNLDAVITVFHSWIQDQVCEELLLDVADYRHVHHGPGVVLIGHEADYAIDNTDGRLGIRYNRKAPLEGSNQDRLAQAVRAVLAAAERLHQDTRLNGKLHFNSQGFEIFVNDRLLAPNVAETRHALEAEFHDFLGVLFGGIEYSLKFESDPRRLFGAKIRTAEPIAVSDLRLNLAVGESSSYDIV
ncbi:MAG: hypothetical protein DMG97_06750 [Acidobacteria bacterium]|nr:MAG: hypothetical protein DMG96_36805 [Acidobacteriota bacterium]PYV75279.1 MAG: hypothetical protein DMG97_06750 [Acidobacteriota bacterium]